MHMCCPADSIIYFENLDRLYCLLLGCSSSLSLGPSPVGYAGSRSRFLIIVSSNKLADKGINKYSDLCYFLLQNTYLPHTIRHNSPLKTADIYYEPASVRVKMREKRNFKPSTLFREGDTTDINNYRHFALHISEFLKIKKKNIPIFNFSSPLTVVTDLHGL